jgi:hypothetical protein
VPVSSCVATQRNILITLPDLFRILQEAFGSAEKPARFDSGIRRQRPKHCSHYRLKKAQVKIPILLTTMKNWHGIHGWMTCAISRNL